MNYRLRIITTAVATAGIALASMTGCAGAARTQRTAFYLKNQVNVTLAVPAGMSGVNIGDVAPLDQPVMTLQDKSADNLWANVDVVKQGTKCAYGTAGTKSIRLTSIAAFQTCYGKAVVKKDGVYGFASVPLNTVPYIYVKGVEGGWIVVRDETNYSPKAKKTNSAIELRIAESVRGSIVA